LEALREEGEEDAELSNIIDEGNNPLNAVHSNDNGP